MKNFQILDNGNIQTAYGVFGGVTSFDTYPNGELRGVLLNQPNLIVTHAGELTPFYTETTRRKHKFAAEYFKNGMLKAVALEEQQDVFTPVGELPAELVTFYDSGELLRVFPLDGKISAYWSESDERALHIPLTFEFDFTKFTALVDCICFYKSGAIRSITLFPGESALIRSAFGDVLCERGFSLNEDGTLKSLQPLEMKIFSELTDLSDCTDCTNCTLCG
jgi:hypothetical protein